MNVFDLFASIKLDDSEYQEGLSSAGSALAGFGKTAAGGLASLAKTAVTTGADVTKAMISGAASTASLGDSIDKQSQKMGISAEAYQEWDFILQHSGSSIDAMNRGMVTLQKNAADNADKFKALGISEEEVAKMSTEELFAKTIEGLQGMGESAERTALANDLLGGAVKELGPLLNTSASDTEAMKQQVHDLGGVLSDEAVKGGAAYADSLQNMQTVFSGMKNTMMGSFLPSMTKTMDGITKVFSGDKGGINEISSGIKDFVSNIGETIPQFMEAGQDILEAFVGAITENLPEIAETGLEVISTLFETIIEQLPQIVESAVQIISTLVQTISEMLPTIIEAGIQLIVTLATSIAEQAPTLIPAILDGLLAMVDALIQNAPELLRAALTLIKALAQGLIDYIPQLIDRLPEIINSIIDFITGAMPEIIEAGIEITIAIAEGLIKAIPQLVQKLPEIITKIALGLLEGLAEIGEVGGRLIEGLWDGIGDKVQWIIDKIKGFGKKIIKGIKDVFGIHSPSKVFAEIGEYMGEGLGLGWDDAVSEVKDQMLDDMDMEGNVVMNTDVKGNKTAGGNTNGNTEGGDTIIPIYIGDTLIEELLIDAKKRITMRSGGMQAI